MLQDYIFIGKILKASGKKGKFKIYPLTDFRDRFKDIEYVYIYNDTKKEFIKEDNEIKKFIIKDTNTSGKYIYIIFDNARDDELKIQSDFYICIEESKRVKLTEGNYYYYELIGCKVYLKDRFIGCVNAIENYGSDDLLVVISDNKKKYYIPMREQFIDKIELKNKNIFIKNVEGLID